MKPPSISIMAIVMFTATTINAFSKAIERQTGTCSDTGQVDCGTDTCLPKGYTCCPDALIGCFTTTAYCYLNSTDTYGCCGVGDTCGDGPGNGTSSGITTSTSHETTKISKTSSAAASTTYPTIISISTIVQTLSPYSHHPSTSPTVSVAATTSTTPSSTAAASRGTRKLGSSVCPFCWMVIAFLGLFVL